MSRLRSYPSHLPSGAALILSLTLGSSGCSTFGGSSQLPVLGSDSAVVIPSNGGVVWSPISWTVQLNQEQHKVLGSPLDNLQLRTISLVVKNLKSKETQLIPMSTGGQAGTAHAVLDTERQARTFYVPLFFPLAEGSYQIEGIRAAYIDPETNRPQQIDTLLANPFQTDGKPPLGFQVKVGRVAALPRMALHTAFGRQGNALNSVTELEPIDADVIPVDVVLDGLKKPATYSHLVYAASPDFPRARVPLTDESGNPTPPEAPVARVGLLLDVPCSATGTLKLVWKRVAEEREYFSLLALAEKAPESCNKTKTLTPVLALPRGDWLLKATQIITNEQKIRTFRLGPLKVPDEYMKTYFLLGKGLSHIGRVQLEQDVERQLAVRLQSHVASGAGGSYVPGSTNPDNSLLFLGRFELNQTKNKKGDVAWETLFKRSYSLAEISKEFRVAEIYNAYTLSRLHRDRAKGIVQSILKVTSSASDAKKVEGYSSEFRKDATEQLAQCLTEREETDPLVNVAGSMNFSVLKGAKSMTVKGIKFDEDGVSQNWVKECFEKKLLTFKFSKRSPSSFDGELRFISQ